MNTKHALCNAHHLREFEALIDIDNKEAWAKKMKKLLLFMYKYRLCFDNEIPEQKISRLEQIYDKIIKQGLTYHLKRREQLLFGGRLTRKRYAGHNLLLRLEKYQEDVLRFLHDPTVPFTNNQAEQDIRMMKVKQKISGVFRTTNGADVFIKLRTFLSTIRKQSLNIFTSIVDAIDNRLPILAT
jgi:transposase